MTSVMLKPVSFERIEAANAAVRRRFQRALQCLKITEIGYAVVGESAVAAWVARADESAVRNTRDVNFLISRDDLPAVAAAMEAKVSFTDVSLR